jgi:hypothetical protein
LSSGLTTRGRREEQSMSGLDELLSETDVTPTPEAETPPAEVVTPEPQAAPQEPAPSEAAPASPAAPTAEPQDHSIPLNVLLRTREELGGKLTATEQRALAAERKLAEIERQRQEAAAQAPDILDDPQAYIEWAERRQREIVRREVAAVQAQQAKAVETISRNMMLRHLGQEKFGELEKFIQAAPDRAHAVALKEADPYGWFYERFEQAQKARKAEEAAKQLNGKSVEEIVAERLAAERAKWEAEHGGGQPQPQAARPADTRQRNADGTFAPTPEPQRHRPKSLTDLNGAAIAAQSAPGHALDGLISD